MSLMEDLDQLMMPYTCKFEQALTPDQWHQWYEWMNNTCGTDGWYVEKNKVSFAKEKNLMLFLLRWS